MDSNELAAEVGHLPEGMPGGPIEDFRAALQDQTDLLNVAQGKLRMLEGRQKLKDDAHRAELVALQDIIKAHEMRTAEIAAGQGMVPRDLHEALGQKLDRALNKLHATRTFAEQQRALNVRWRTGAAAAMLGAGLLRDLLLETLPPAPPAKVIEGPSSPADPLALCSTPTTGVIG